MPFAHGHGFSQWLVPQLVHVDGRPRRELGAARRAEADGRHRSALYGPRMKTTCARPRSRGAHPVERRDELDAEIATQPTPFTREAGLVHDDAARHELGRVRRPRRSCSRASGRAMRLRLRRPFARSRSGRGRRSSSAGASPAGVATCWRVVAGLSSASRARERARCAASSTPSDDQLRGACLRR